MAAAQAGGCTLSPSLLTLESGAAWEKGPHQYDVLNHNAHHVMSADHYHLPTKHCISQLGLIQEHRTEEISTATF